MTRSSGNVFLDIGFPPREAYNLHLRSQLMARIEQVIKTRGLTQSQAAKLFGVTQPRISDLVRGRINLFSLDMLVKMLANARMMVKVDVECLA